jgi:hypothetical protein
VPAAAAAAIVVLSALNAGLSLSFLHDCTDINDNKTTAITDNRRLPNRLWAFARFTNLLTTLFILTIIRIIY